MRLAYDDKDVTEDSTLVPREDFTPVGKEHVSSREKIHFLVVMQGLNSGSKTQLFDKPISIGRTPPNDLVFPDPIISRRHCQVTLLDHEVVVTDLSSTNGTFIDGVRVETTMTLPEEGILQVGGQILIHECRNKQEVEEMQELDHDLEKASRYIYSLLPPPIDLLHSKIDWYYLPSNRLGGDALGYHAVDEHTLAFYLIDVSGHGASAAMHAASILNVLLQRSLPNTDFKKPALVLKGLNSIFQMENHGDLFFTMWYGVYEATARKLSYCSAGHHPGFLVSADRLDMTPLKTRNLMVGVLGDYVFHSNSVDVPEGSVLYLFSDGVFEIITKTGQLWSLKDFLPLLVEPVDPALSEPLRLYRSVKRVSRDGPLDDDFSILVVDFK
jgi:serine phosphatase RsbU (regulator of sigma subunit)